MASLAFDRDSKAGSRDGGKVVVGRKALWKEKGEDFRHGLIKGCWPQGGLDFGQLEMGYLFSSFAYHVWLSLVGHESEAETRCREADSCLLRSERPG